LRQERWFMKEAFSLLQAMAQPSNYWKFNSKGERECRPRFSPTGII
jgi:hypothetical protein